MAFLDETGLSRFLAKLKTWFSSYGHAATATTITGVLPVENGGTGSSTKNFVDLSTNQDISGSKKLLNMPTIYHRTPRLALVSSANTMGGEYTTNDYSFYYRDKDNYNLGFITYTCRTSDEGGALSFCVFSPRTRTNAARAQLTLEGGYDVDDNWLTRLRPASKGKLDLGDNTYNYKDIYAVNGTIQTSDENEKSNISKFPDEVLDAWEDVGFVQFRFNSAIDIKGDSARLHSGIIAQQIYRAFSAHGLDAFRYGLLCRNTWEASEREESYEVRAEVRDESGNIIEPAIMHTEHVSVPAGESWSVRYAEALCLEAAYQRRRADRLEARIAGIEEKLNG